MIIFDVTFEVLHEAVNTLREQGDLNFRRAGVFRVRPVLTDSFDLSFLSQSHGYSFSSTS